ncbi:hypothetical protein CHUAL_002623 [Chamberlinius hualienensis]
MAYKCASCKNDEDDKNGSNDNRREEQQRIINPGIHSSPIPSGIRDTPTGMLNRLGYKMGKTIGTGSYSKVRIVEMHTNPEVKLAVKIISRKLAAQDFVGKFLPREIQILQKVQHQFIVKVHRIIEIGYDIYIFMDLAETDLLSYIQGKGSALSLDEAQRFFSHIVDAVEYLHQRNICHRDLKCENILLFPNHVAKLSDFGFAKEILQTDVSMENMSKTFCGSPAYAAPEILSGTPYDPRLCDVWSLGCILFILVTGIMPFSDRNLKTMLENQQNKVINFPHDFDRKTGNLAKHLISRMLEPQVVKRIRIEDISKHPWMLFKL